VGAASPVGWLVGLFDGDEIPALVDTDVHAIIAKATMAMANRRNQ
jgi:hypothetical protein